MPETGEYYKISVINIIAAVFRLFPLGKDREIFLHCEKESHFAMTSVDRIVNRPAGDLYMETITYRNVLKPEKTLADYQGWLKKFWAVQKSWGATSYEVWQTTQENENILFCRFIVNDVQEWNRRVSSPGSRHLVKSLGRIVDLDRISLTITLSPPQNA
jgi:hypothetical protein